ncbi:MAG TPA: circularly permuted type 2 ATP-grasp protein [Vicinamibacteria bacterium]|nr:circularly permuted type 2 ATP-grasp protein [Vicinamibacteria bacterium]
MAVPDAIAAYHRLLEADEAGALEQARRLEESFGRRGVTFAGQPMSSFVRPHFVSRVDFDALRTAASRLVEICARVARQAHGGDLSRLLAFLGTPEAEARHVRVDPGEPDVVLSRVDAFLAAGQPRFIEINSDAPAGFGYGDRMAELLREVPVFAAFAKKFKVGYAASAPSLLDAVQEIARSTRAGSSATVAIVDWAEVKTRADQEILREAFAARGVSCFLADPRDAERRSGRLSFGGRVADVVYRRAVLSELCEREAESRVFLEAYRGGEAVFVNSLRCRVSEDKAFFAILTDETFEELLSVDERDFVARVVPWTRRVEERHTTRRGQDVDLVPHVLAEREGLVLKPAHGYGGASVYVGSETPASHWEAAVTTALSGAWVVQERVEIPEEPFPVVENGALAFRSFKVNVNPFYVRGAEVGAVTRASRSAVINVSAGGGSLPTFVLED